MPVQLRILAIVFTLWFLIFTIRSIRKDRAEVRHMLKWFILALVMFVGSVFPELGIKLAGLMGIHTLASLALFVLTGMLLVISIRYQMSLISAEKQIKNLVQEISLLKKKVDSIEHDEK